MEGIVSQPATKLPTRGMFPSICSGVKGAGDTLRPQGEVGTQRLPGDMQSAGEVPGSQGGAPGEGCDACGVSGGQKSFRQRRERPPPPGVQGRWGG